ncbi:HTH-type transcriptional regulator YofA [mine drainage metagenome]|uniref:HTH-type transcriptional regulator YofA n=1 Tax=mine drainage metagenome TaxID=410659 RepID=A0A1J5SA40_9ZZZZ
MEIDLARTFIEITKTGSFISAAERLFITQTTVTARMHNLEEQLKCRLFVRNRSGATLTENGKHFLTHANQLVQVWEAARRDLPIPIGTEASITIGGEFSLWNPLMLTWLNTHRECHPNIALHVEIGESRTLHQKLEQGLIDLALVHHPEYWVGMQVEQVLEEKLVMVRSTRKSEPYVFIDWGEDFRRQHNAALPQFSSTSLSVNFGPLALIYLQQNGGSGYFRTRVVQAYLQDGTLELVPEAPEFSYPVYLIYLRKKNNDFISTVIEQLKEVINLETDWSQRNFVSF